MNDDLSGKQQELQVLEAALAGEYSVSTLDVHDLPLFLAFAAPANDLVTGHKLRLPSGRGLSKVQARIAAAAEAIELRACLARNIHRSSHTLHKVEGVDHVTLTPIGGGKPVPVAAQSVFLDYAAETGETLIKDADTTGCATGTSLADAQRRALLECIERDAVATWWYGQVPRPTVAPQTLDKASPRLAWWLANRERQTLLLDVTSDIAVPCVAAISSDNDGLNVAIGSAAALTIGDAALSAVLEMLQTEVSMTLGSSQLNRDLVVWQRSASVKTMPQFSPDGEADPTGPVRTADLPSLLAAQNFTAYVTELTLKNDPLPTVRVIVPGFSALNRSINSKRILAARTKTGRGDDFFEHLEPY